MFDRLVNNFVAVAPRVDFWTLRFVEKQVQTLSIRQDIIQPVSNRMSSGVFISVHDQGGYGYAATCDLTTRGLEKAFNQAVIWARNSAEMSLLPAQLTQQTLRHGYYKTVLEKPWSSKSLSDKIEWLRMLSARLKSHDQIVAWEASLQHRFQKDVIVSSVGTQITQEYDSITPELAVVANEGSETQRRTYGSDLVFQGGLEYLENLKMEEAAERISEEALTLLAAPECPSAVLDLLLMPGQMLLQIHESIGHPLELDRILGDERNYAGGSFVKPEMFGHYQYGSALLNITFNPEYSSEVASFAYDDEATPATREYLINQGILQKPLGGHISQARAGLSGVACSRAEDWHRPPIDRMANLNLEPGKQSLAELIGGIEEGILMDTNRSWSIDDHRNKFQFSCEFGQLIKNGQLQGLVKNPGYRGVSANFWRNLVAVGDEGTFQVMGTNFCGKGEPNQVIHVGHASPACVFTNIEVFGRD